MLKLKVLTFMIYMEKLSINRLVSRKILSFLFFSFLFVGIAHCQMTNREMDNFKKLDKNRQKKQKQKGPSINTKKRLLSPKKTRQKKSSFSKKHYKVAWNFKEEELNNPFS